ncbi:hypothetical protein M408DRAFT_230775 [Serendipita vermifera MAFF 305830]|uniref:Zinc knuckle domain-containing protein n=1 Tax=Serendipita vermifera MAFF 305830 TaxID=933852 RepID=A0A0C2X601_SERVB|nr:hypothetical protein M408DRAFT_230775 [Serendipita vermifera MAFF 305830]
MSRFAPHRPSSSNPRPSADTVCQKCLQRGHYTFNCKTTARPYATRPSRTQMLENPDKFAKIARPAVNEDLPDEFLSKKGLADKILKENALKREAEEQAAKRKLALKGAESRRVFKG